MKLKRAPLLVTLSWLLAVCLVPSALGAVGDAPAAAPMSGNSHDNAICLNCHDSNKKKLEVPGAEGQPRALHGVTPEAFAKGVHADMRCIDCHTDILSIERGGKATYHGPGQVVFYPIVHLGEGNRDVRRWVQHLEALVVRLPADHGIAARTKLDLPGVWTVVTDKKIASIGVAIQHWVSFHGVAINVTLDPKEFERIDPCGLGASVMTSMASEGADATVENVRSWLAAHGPAHFATFSQKEIQSH